MNTQVKIWLALFLTGVFLAIGLWHLINLRGYRARGDRRSDSQGGRSKGNPKTQRRSDKRTLTSHEKKLFAESQRLLSQGKITTAARILEQISMSREAIQALEEHGMIHEAARILMRMQRPNRAGVVYARHGMWEHAAQCFRIANMPLEAAKCSLEANDIPQAADLFEKAERYETSADCHLKIGNHFKAFRLYLKGGNTVRATEALNRFAESGADLHGLSMEEQELQFVVDTLSRGVKAPGLVKIAAWRHKLVPAIQNLIKKGMVGEACELLRDTPSDLGPMLMAEIDYKEAEAQTLAEVFVALGMHLYAGMVWERSETYGKAGAAYERAGDIDRALYCYERGRLDDRVQALRSGKPAAPSPEATLTPEKDHLFVLTGFNDPNTAQSSQFGFNDHAMEKTKVIAVEPRTEENSVEAGSSDGFDVFVKCKFLSDLSEAQKKAFWDMGETIMVQSNDTFLDRSHSGSGLYIVLSGAVSCPDSSETIGSSNSRITPGGYFGELWLLTEVAPQGPYLADGPTLLFLLERQKFATFLDQDGVLARKFYKRFTEHLVQVVTETSRKSRQVAS